MRTRNPLGWLSLVAGSLALPSVLIATYLASAYGKGDGYLVRWLDVHGLIRTAPLERVPELRAHSFWVINDEIAIQRLLFVGIVLGIAAMIAARVAEYRDESTLYLAPGFIGGVLGISMYNPLLGLVAMIIGGVALLVIRRRA